MIEKQKIFPQSVISKLEDWEKRYPKEQKRSVIIPGLHVLQEYNSGYLTTKLMEDLAQYLEVPVASVFEVATFYSMYDLERVGCHKLNVCTNVSCMLNGANELLSHIEKRLNIRAGETTADGCITLREVECQGACCDAPMLEVDKVFYERLTIEKVDQIIDSLE